MKFTEEHHWLRPEDDEDDVVTVGMTERGVAELGDLIFAELPEEGTTVAAEDSVMVIEGEDETAEIMAPLDGEIVEVNEGLEDDPGLINEDPMGSGWLFRMRVENMDDYAALLDEAAYKRLL